MERNGGMGGEGRAIGQSRLVELCLWKVGEREGVVPLAQEGRRPGSVSILQGRMEDWKSLG